MTDKKEQPELIVDEDWKAQVQREKEAAVKDAASDDTASENAASDAVVDLVEEPVADQPVEQNLPPASLPMLITSLGTQAMVAMGIMPGEGGKPLPVNLAFSKHFIDLIGVLEEKTAGNLSDQEKQYLQDTLYQLRMAFVEAKKRPQ